MKIRDVVEAGYGLIDDPATGVSKAAVRQQNLDISNKNIRSNNDAKNANDEANIKNSQAVYSEKRKRVTPTGIPARLLNPTPPIQQVEQQ